MGEWWDPNDAGLSVLAAYDPYTADSIEHSYMDRSGNGNDASAGTAPSWANGTGWTFASASSQYLTTTFVPASDQSQSVIVLFSGVTNTGWLCGVSDGTNGDFGIVPDNGSSKVAYYNGGTQTSTGAEYTAGSLGVAGSEGYRDGVDDSASIGAWTGATSLAFYIGCVNDDSVASNFLSGTIKLMAVYDVTLTAQQVADVVDAMRQWVAQTILVSVWDKATWSPLDAKFEDTVNAICVGAEDGHDESLYDLYVGFDAVGEAQVAGSATVTNDGTAGAWPTLVISRDGAGGTAVITSLRNETTGDWVAFDYALLDGEELQIDFRRRRLRSTIAGDVMDRMLAGDLFVLQPGDNVVTFFVRTTPAPTITAYLTYRDTYLSSD